MKQKTIQIIFMASVLIAPYTYAQSSVTDTGMKTKSLTLDEARSLAISKSPAIRKYTLAVDQAVLVKKAQDYSGMPNLSADGTVTYDDTSSSSPGKSAAAGISASITLFDGGKNAALSQKYNLAIQEARENLREERITLLDTIDAAFFAVLEDKASLDAAQSDLDAAKFRLEIAEVKSDAGTLSKSDLLQTQSEIASYQATLDKARATFISAKAKLVSLAGISMSVNPAPIDFSAYDQIIRKLGTLNESDIENFVGSVVVMARTNSPTLSGYLLTAGQARQTLTAAKGATLPTLSASTTGTLKTGSDADTASGSITLSASVDLDFWTLRNSVKQAQNSLAQAELDTIDQRTTLELNVEQAVYSWLASALTIPSSATALEYAKTNYQNVLEKFKLSSATSSDLSTAQALVSTDETALISARYAFLSSLSTLRGLAGLEDETVIISAVK
jgi:outer membrane protein